MDGQFYFEYLINIAWNDGQKRLEKFGHCGKKNVL